MSFLFLTITRTFLISLELRVKAGNLTMDIIFSCYGVIVLVLSILKRFKFLGLWKEGALNVLTCIEGNLFKGGGLLLSICPENLTNSDY